MSKSELLKFGKGNAKLDKTIITFSLPAGRTCPFAKDCKTYVVKDKDDKLHLERAKDIKFQCFAATSEALYKNVFNTRAHNLSLLNKCSNSTEMKDLILKSLPKKFDKCRIHVSGDFFNENYLQAWIDVAKSLNDKVFYAYTKSVPYIINKKDLIPENLVVTCSLGGQYDIDVFKHDLKRVKVYFHPDDAKKEGNEIDHDDSLAMNPNIKEFGLLLHGSQPKDTEASKALQRMRKENIKFGYA